MCLCKTHLLSVEEQQFKIIYYTADAVIAVDHQPPSLAGLIFTPGPMVEATVQDLMY